MIPITRSLEGRFRVDINDDANSVMKEVVIFIWHSKHEKHMLL